MEKHLAGRTLKDAGAECGGEEVAGGLAPSSRLLGQGHLGPSWGDDSF